MPYKEQRSANGSLNDQFKTRGRSRRQTLEKIVPSLSTRHSGRNDFLPTIHLVERAPQGLVIPARNVRKVDPEHVRAIANAIAAIGFRDPVLIDETDTVIDGVARIKAAESIGLDTIPCLVASHLTSSQKQQLRLALNRLQEKGIWDIAELRFVMEELILENVSLEFTGFTGTDVDQILLEEEPNSVETGPLEPDLNAEAVAKLGDIYVLGAHRIICGDARDLGVLGSLMAGEYARLILTDEPYNVPIGGHVTKGAHREFAMASGEMSEAEFRAFNTAWMQAALAFLCDGGLFGTFIDWRGFPVVNAAAGELGLTPLNLVVWAKTNAGLGSLYRSQHELFPLFKKHKTAAHTNNIRLGKDGRWRSNLWRYPGASSMGSDARKGLRDHPTVKPTAMLEDALLDLTNRGDIVLDPFLGSGSTLIAAEKTGRRCRGVEIDPYYVDVIVRRYEALTGKQAVLESSPAAPAD